MPCSVLRLWIEPDTSRGRQDPQVHHPALRQLPQRDKQESAEDAAMGQRAGVQNPHEHYCLRHRHP